MRGIQYRKPNVRAMACATKQGTSPAPSHTEYVQRHPRTRRPGVDCGGSDKMSGIISHHFLMFLRVTQRIWA